MTTDNGTALVPAAPRPVASWTAVRNLAEAIQLANIVHQSAAFPDVRTPAMAVVKIMAGAEMGFGPFASLADVHVIEGKPAIGAHLRAAAIKASANYDYRVVELSKERCELEFFERRGEGKFEPVGRVAVTMQEALDSGLALSKEKDKDGKPIVKRNWRVHPDDMLFARAVSKGYRRFCPDLSGGVLAYTPEELEPDDDRPSPPPATVPLPPGAVIDAEVVASYRPGAPPTFDELAREHRRTPEDLGRAQAAATEALLDDAGKAARLRQLIVQGQARSVQVDRIMELAGRLGTPAESLRARLRAKYRVDSLAHLTHPEAEEVEGAFRKALEAKEKAPAAATKS